MRAFLMEPLNKSIQDLPEGGKTKTKFPFPAQRQCPAGIAFGGTSLCRIRKLFNQSFLITALLFFCTMQAQAQTVSVALVWDESGSISNFDLQAKGFAEALDGLPTNGHVEVSLLGFSSDLFELANKVVLTNRSIHALRSSLTSHAQSKGATDTAAAIARAAAILRSSKAAAKIICLSTDGLPSDVDAAEIAARSARQSDAITIAPIGVGLEADGRDFLNRIASAPPVPTPTGFHAFAEVVDNDCVGEIKSVLHLSFTPDHADFGVLSASAEPVKEAIGVHNNSHGAAVITDIAITGEDAAYFTVNQAFGSPLSDLAGVPYRFSALRRDTVEVELDASKNNGVIPGDGTYNAALTVTARPDRAGAEAGIFSVPLTARVGPADLSVKVWDANGVIDRLNDNRSLSLGLDEKFLADKTQITRSGLVADGNAMLFLTANTNRVDDDVKRVKFEIVGPTGARLHKLSGNLLTDGSTSENVSLVEVGDSRGLATVILRAGASFPAGVAAAESGFTVTACIEGMCDQVKKEVMLVERRAPVVLIHGLWSSRKTWERRSLLDRTSINMTNFLQQKHFDAHPIQYDGNKNPTPEELEELLTVTIGDICRGIMHEQGRGLACTKADLLTHSMGGLVARNFIQNTKTYRNPSNFYQGSVRRYIPMATPQQGSYMGNVLVGNHKDPRCQLSAGQLLRAKLTLEVTGRGVDTAVSDVAVGSDFLKRINGAQPHPNAVPTHTIYGDTGTKLSTLVKVLVDLIKKDCTHEAIFGDGEHSDGIVPVASAINEGRLSNTMLGMVDHLDMTDNRRAGEIYVELLNSNDILGDFVLFAAKDQRQFLFASASSSFKEYKEASLWNKTKQVLQNTFSKALKLTEAIAQQAEPSLSLSSSVSEVAPGQNIVLTAALKNAATAPSVLLVEMDGDLVMEDETPPYEWLIPTPEQIAGTLSFRAVSVVDDKVIASSVVSVLVMPHAGGLVQINFVPGNLLYMSVGRTEQLKVFGRFHDGFSREITDPATGTTYSEMIVDGVNIRSGDSQVIEVDNKGVVTALSPGAAEVMAHNQGYTGNRRILVRENDLSPSSSSGGGGSFSPFFIVLLSFFVLAGLFLGLLRRSKSKTAC